MPDCGAISCSVRDGRPRCRGKARLRIVRGNSDRASPLPRTRPMGITFRPLHPVFVAECSGVDIGLPLSPQDSAAIDEGMDRYAVLVFRRSAPLSTEQQIAFTEN